jgi:penicillin V acylase-like amidase (Ntn superfamily)
MNRHGVAVSDMSVDGVQAPFDAGKPNILHATAMRLVLDDAKNIDEAIDIFKRYNIHFGATTCHFMVADATGKSAVIEFVDGQVAVTDSNENWQVCTNHQICGASEEESDKTCDRYRHATDELAKMSATAGIEDVMRIMQSVSKKDWTMWSSAYDLSSRRFRFAYRGQFDKPYDDCLANSK